MIGIRFQEQARSPFTTGRPSTLHLRWPKISIRRLVLLTLFWGLLIEGLLVGRLYYQLSDQPVDTGTAGFIYRTSGALVSPFAGFEPSTSIKETGILQISTLIALDFYLIAMISILTAIFWFRIGRAMFRGYMESRRQRRASAVQPEPVHHRSVASIASAAEPVSVAPDTRL